MVSENIPAKSGMSQSKERKKVLSLALIFSLGAVLGGVLTLGGFLILWGFFTRPAEPRLADFRPHRLPPITNPKSTIGVIGRMALVVERVEPDGPAEKAGLQVGDMLVALNNHQINSADDYVIPIYMIPPGESHDVYFYRTDLQTGKMHPKEVKVVSAPWTTPGEPKLPAESGKESR